MSSTADGGHETRTIPLVQSGGQLLEWSESPQLGVVPSPAFGVPGQNENVTEGRMK